VRGCAMPFGRPPLTGGAFPRARRIFRRTQSMAAALIDDRSTHLAIAARDGDLVALDTFVRALHHDVRRYVAHLSADPHSADDLTQETFLRALQSLHRFEG